MILRLMLSLVLMLGLAGCATMRKDTAATEDMQIRVSDLERRLQEKDDQIHFLESRLEATRKTETTKMSQSSNVKGTTREIQTALKNSGYYQGTIDGKMGRLTKSAITAFQKENGLKADGVVGQQTWAKLSGYLQ